MLKKYIILVITACMIILLCGFIIFRITRPIKNSTKQENKEYEQYLNTNIYGTDVATLINKAINQNENNNVSKDEKGLYIPNQTNSLLIEVVMITEEETKETTSYKMEAINKLGIAAFMQNFNTAQFVCTNKEYHTQTGKIAYIELTQVTI